MQGHRPLIRFPRIHDPMHRLPRIDRARIRRRQLHRVRCEQFALSRLDILKSDMKIFDQQLSHRSCHPAILVAMIVHGTALSHIPTNRDYFIEIGFIDQIACVILRVPGQIRRKAGFIDSASPPAMTSPRRSPQKPLPEEPEASGPVRQSELAAVLPAHSYFNP